MIHFFCGKNEAGPYFEGWYLKHQTSQGQALALIPAFHIGSGGQCTASLQVISSDAAWWLEYPESQLQFSRQPFQVQIGPSSFNSQGIVLHIEQDGLPSTVRCATARLLFSGPTLWGRSDFLRECSVPMESSAWDIL